MTLVPVEESLDAPIRKTEALFPELAIRELVANSLIHQDFNERGSGVMVELFDSRIEISNPGRPLINIDRFIDSPPKSRNEKLVSLMRRMGICEERGSGIDKVIFEVELKNLTRQDRIRACYFHACLKYTGQDYMTNTSIRERFWIDRKNVAMASRIIKDALGSNIISIYDESAGAKSRKYTPAWAKE